MCDCCDSSDASANEMRNLIGGYGSKLKTLSFSNYEKNGYCDKLLETAVYLLDIDTTKISVERSDNEYKNFDTFYDGKPLRVRLPAFTAKV